MSKLVWDAVGEHWYETGVKQGVLYVQKTDGTYHNGVAWNGLTGVDESPEGAEPNDIWADNIKYASPRSAETYGGSITAYTYPDEWAECDGSVLHESGAKIGQQGRKPFGFCYRTELGNDTASEGDDAYIIHIVWNATANPSEKSHETINDSPDAIEMSWDFDCIPVMLHTLSGMKPCSKIELDSRRIGADGMAAAEAILYGSNSTAPTLPTPDALLMAILEAVGGGTLGEIGVASAAGTNVGGTAITISDYTLPANASYVYKVAAGTAPSIAYHDTPDYTWTAWDGASDINVGASANGNKITIAAIDSTDKVLAAGNATLVVKTA